MRDSVREFLSRARPLQRAVRWRRRRRLTTGLQALNDALAASPLEGRWWVWGGMLLGWAREGRLLGHDLLDADFAYCDEDHDRFLACVPLLVGAGFTPTERFVNNDGLVTEHRFMFGGARIEFFRLVPTGGLLRSWAYADSPELIQVTAEIVDQPKVPFTFLDRTWLKSEDHESELERMYGDWRTPDPSFSYLDDLSIVARESWQNPMTEWLDPLATIRTWAPSPWPRSARSSAISSTSLDGDATRRSGTRAPKAPTTRPTSIPLPLRTSSTYRGSTGSGAA